MLSLQGNTRVLVINSEDRTDQSQSTSQFSIKIQPAIINARRISLAAAIIPNSTYNINSTKNVLSWSDAGPHTITITPGSYNATTLGAEVAAAMTAIGSQIYTVIYNPATYHYTISAPGNFSLLYATAAATGSSIFPTLGYRFTVDSGAALSHESNIAVQIWDLPYFVIRVDKIPFHVQTTQSNSNYGAFVVNNTEAQNGNITHWREGDNFNQISNINVNIDQLFVELRDNRGELAHLNGSDWTFIVTIDHD